MEGDALPRIRVFLSSPGDVGEERRLALAAIDRVEGWYRGQVELDAVSWEREPLPADAPFQDGIPRASACDLAVVILWSRLGSPLPRAYARADGSRPTGTEWEFEDALDGASTGRTHVLVYRRTADPAPVLARAYRQGKDAVQAQLAQLDLVEDFFDRHFQDPDDGTNARAYHAYDTPGAFAQRFQEHLRAYVEDRLGAGGVARAAWQGSPFRGLLAFEPEHERVFFGRTRAIHEVRQALAEQVARGVGFVLVLGRSGSGKSSLLRAGLVPLLSDPGVVDPALAGNALRYALMKPADGADPFEALALALSEEAAFRGARGTAARGATRNPMTSDRRTGTTTTRRT